MTEIPRTGLAAYIQGLAAKHNVVCVRTATDQLAKTITRLSGDDVGPDEIEDLLVALKRAKVIDEEVMVHLLGSYLDEKRMQVTVSVFIAEPITKRLITDARAGDSPADVEQRQSYLDAITITGRRKP